MASTAMSQSLLFEDAVMPRTRFQGSKRKLADWIVDELKTIQFETVLDAFGGTGSVGHAFKRRGKSVTYNDSLRFNQQIGLALIENNDRRLLPAEIDEIVLRHDARYYDNVVERSFPGIYFTDDENRWIDTAAGNIEQFTDPYARALAWYALFQSALIKRPYNLFHRRNLYMRQADVRRSFGNKATWDRPFDVHFRAFAAEANRAVFDNGRPCRALCDDALHIPGDYDLVYIDPPYVNGRGVGVDYRHFYHFLEGLTDYARWPQRIDWSSPHRRLTPEPDPWSCPSSIVSAFGALFARFADSVLVVSYRSDGIPSIDDLVAMLRRFKRQVRVATPGRYQYALSTNKRSREMLVIAR